MGPTLGLNALASGRRSSRILGILLLYLFLEGLCFASLLVLDRLWHLPYSPNIAKLADKQRNRLTEFFEKAARGPTTQHATLGWINGYEVNSGGMRDDRDYEIVPPEDVIRIAAFGDSFTFGSDVELEESWARQMSVMNPAVQVLNYGVGAYGLDQAYLRYLDTGAEYHPDIVFLGYMSENLARNVNVFRAFYGRWYRHATFTKPRFTERNGELILLENPLSTVEDYRRFLRDDRAMLRELGANDYHYQRNYNRSVFDFLPSVRFAKIFWFELRKQRVDPIFTSEGMYNTESEAYTVTVKIFDAFYRQVLKDGSLPIVVVFPDIGDQRRGRNGEPRRYAPLLEDLHAGGRRFIDALDALERSDDPIDDLVVRWGHYSALGSEIVAEHLLQYLVDQELTDRSSIDAAVRSERERLGVVPPIGPPSS